MPTFKCSAEDDRIGPAAPLPNPRIANAALQHPLAGRRTAIQILKTFTTLILIALSALALRLLLSLPNGIVQ
jgi:hypothetical protein